MPLAKLKNWKRNPRKNDATVPAIVVSLKRFGWGRPLVARVEDRELMVGHATAKAARELVELWRLESKDPEKLAGWHEEAILTGRDGLVPVRLKKITANDAHLLAVGDNRIQEKTQWDDPELAKLLGEHEEADRLAVGFTANEWAALTAGLAEGSGGRNTDSASGKLLEAFGEPPFSVLDTRSPRWKARKLAWFEAGVRSQEGRDGSLLGLSEFAAEGRKTKQSAKLKGGKTFGMTMHAYDGGSDRNAGSHTGTSSTDPVLCELAISWFSAKGWLVVDPYAGGTVTGAVSGISGRRFIGLELRPEQVKANRAGWAQLAKRFPDAVPPEWREGTARELLTRFKPESIDLVLSSPPYMNLEVYSSDRRDLSAMKPDDFAAQYAGDVRELVAKVKQDRFIVWVISEVREKGGIGAYRNFVGMSVAAFEAAGAKYYNEIALVKSIGSLPVRVRRQFEGSRKLGRCHENVLVFVKGDPKRAAEACGKAERVEWGTTEPEGPEAEGEA